MQWQDINKYVYSAVGVGAIGLIVMITLLGNVNVEYTNFPECVNGTECYAKFLVSLNKSNYWTSICFDINESIDVPQYYKKSATARTLWLKTSKWGFIRTEPKIPNKLMISTTKSNSIAVAPDGNYLRDIKTGDCITKTKNSSLYVQATKPLWTEVTWKMDLFNIDPTWAAEFINLTDTCIERGENIEDECITSEKYYAFPCTTSCYTYANGTKYKRVKYNSTSCSYLPGKCIKTKPIFIVAGTTIDLKKELNMNCKYVSTEKIECDECVGDGNCDGICQSGESCAFFTIRYQDKEFKDYHKTELENKLKEKVITDE